MGLVANLIERRSTLAAPADWLRESLLGPRGATGRRVGAEQALTLGAVYACVSLISETIASLPWHTYRRLSGGGRDKATTHAIYALLHDDANPQMTSFEFRDAMNGHLELWGNAYAEIEVDEGNRPIALWPLRPDRMVVNTAGGQERRLSYQYTVPSGRSLFIPSERMLHYRGLSPDGLVGYSRISLAREAFGLGLGLEEYASRFFGNDARPGGVLEHPGKLSDDAAQRLKTRWEAAHRGLSNAHRVAVLEEGVSWKSIGIPPQDAQFLESRSFQRGEIASWFRVPPHMIGDVDKTSSWGTGVEQQSIGFVTYTLSTRLANLEKRTNRALLLPSERGRYFTEFNVDGLLRGDSASRAAYLHTMRNDGVINANEWRALENMNPQEGDQGDDYLVPLNLVPADLLRDVALPTDIPGPRPSTTVTPVAPAGQPGGQPGGPSTKPALPAPTKTPATPAMPAAMPSAAKRDYSCRKCRRLLFRSDAERGRIETVCPERTCKELQTVLLGGEQAAAR